MTVSSSQASETFACNGATTVFTCPFRVLAGTDMRVFRITIATGAVLELTNVTDFDVSNVDEDNAIVTTVATYSSSYRLRCTRSTARLQATDYRDNDPFPAESHERALDRLTMIAQEDEEAIGRAVRVPDGETISELASAAARALKLLGFDSTGGLSLSTPADQSAASLALLLASYALNSEGAGMVGYSRSLAYAANTIGSKMRERVSVFDFMSTLQIADVVGRTALVDVTAAITAALAYQDTSTVGSFELYFPDGTYLVSGAGARILEVQNGTKILGASLEGTRIRVAPGSTATAVIEDNGSAAKTEIYNLTVDIHSNASVTSGIRLGRRTTQFGSYGGMDNVMVRDGFDPACIGYDLNCNVISLGRLYTSSVPNGLIHASGGVGLHVETFCPIDFSGIGLQLSQGDSVNFVEVEAPGSDDAVPISLARGGKVDNFILSVQAGRKVKTVVSIDPVYVDDFEIARTELIVVGDGFYGDSATPADSGTATAGAAGTLTDTSKTWTRNQWKGSALYITGGTGSGQHIRLAGNSKDTLTFIGSLGTAPDATSTYAVDRFIKKVGGGGYATSDSGTVFDTTTETLSATDTATVNKLVVGKSNHSVALQGLMKVADTHDFASVAVGAVSAARSVTVQGAQVGMPVLIGIPDAVRSTGAQVMGCVSAANTVKYYLQNPTTGGAIDAASQTYTIVVMDYA